MPLAFESTEEVATLVLYITKEKQLQRERDAPLRVALNDPAKSQRHYERCPTTLMKRLESSHGVYYISPLMTEHMLSVPCACEMMPIKRRDTIHYKLLGRQI